MEQEILQQTSQQRPQKQEQHVFLQMKYEELMKNRSYAKTIKAAWKAFIENFKTIFRHIWPYAIGLAFVSALYVLNTVKLTSNNIDIIALITLFFTFILLLLVSVVFAGRADMLINPKSFLWNIGRAFKLFVFEGIVLILFGAILILIAYMCSPDNTKDLSALHQAGPSMQDIVLQQNETISAMKTGAIIMATSFAFTLLLLPFVYVSLKYIIDTETRILKIFWSGYKIGLRYWGYIFLTMLVTFIIVLFPSVLISLPTSLLNLAIHFNEAGVANGDPNAIPSYIGILTFITAFISYFLLAFISIFCLFIGYYVYGTIETRQQERKGSQIYKE